MISPFERSILGHIAAKLVVELLTGSLSCIGTRRNTTVVALRTSQRLRNTFDRLVLGAVLRYGVGAFFVI